MFSQECGPLESLLNYYHNTNTVRVQGEGNSKGAVFVASLCVRSQGDQEKEKKGMWTARCHSASDMYLEYFCACQFLNVLSSLAYEL